MPKEIRGDAIRSSASVPLFFEPVDINDQVLVDGGIFSNLNFHESINRCRDNGFKDEDIIIDIIACFDKVVEVPQWTVKDIFYSTALTMWDRKMFLYDL